MSDPVRVYVNGHCVDVPAGATALDAVRASDAQVADRVTAGDRTLTDSRGLPLDPATVIVAGSIVRIVSGRRRGADSE